MISRNYLNDIEIRKRQIDTLKIFNHNVTEIVPYEEYLVGFQSNGREINIQVSLGNNFPNELPRLIIKPILNHHWIDKITGEIRNAPGLLNFTVHSDVGRVVQAIIREYERNPPQMVSDVIQQNDAVQQINENCSFPQLNQLSIEELTKLDTDLNYLDDFIDECGFIKNLDDELNTLMYQVEQLANENMSKEQILVQLKANLNGCSSKFSDLGHKYEQLNTEYKRKSEEFTPQHIRELLQIAVSTADTTCENYIENFLNGEVDTQTFLLKYMEAKKLYSMRKAKEERLSIQLSALEKATY